MQPSDTRPVTRSRSSLLGAESLDNDRIPGTPTKSNSLKTCTDINGIKIKQPYVLIEKLDSPRRTLRSRTTSPEISKEPLMKKEFGKKMLGSPSRKPYRSENLLVTVDSPKPRRGRLDSTKSDTPILRRSRRLSTELNIVEEDPSKEDESPAETTVPLSKTRYGKRLSVLPSQPSVPEETESESVNNLEKLIVEETEDAIKNNTDDHWNLIKKAQQSEIIVLVNDLKQEKSKTKTLPDELFSDVENSSISPLTKSKRSNKSIDRDSNDLSITNNTNKDLDTNSSGFGNIALNNSPKQDSTLESQCVSDDKENQNVSLKTNSSLNTTSHINLLEEQHVNIENKSILIDISDSNTTLDKLDNNLSKSSKEHLNASQEVRLEEKSLSANENMEIENVHLHGNSESMQSVSLLNEKSVLNILSKECKSNSSNNPLENRDVSFSDSAKKEDSSEKEDSMNMINKSQKETESDGIKNIRLTAKDIFIEEAKQTTTEYDDVEQKKEEKIEITEETSFVRTSIVTLLNQSKKIKGKDDSFISFEENNLLNNSKEFKNNVKSPLSSGGKNKSLNRSKESKEKISSPLNKSLNRSKKLDNNVNSSLLSSMENTSFNQSNKSEEKISSPYNKSLNESKELIKISADSFLESSEKNKLLNSSKASKEKIGSPLNNSLNQSEEFKNNVNSSLLSSAKNKSLNQSKKSDEKISSPSNKSLNESKELKIEGDSFLSSSEKNKSLNRSKESKKKISSPSNNSLNQSKELKNNVNSSVLSSVKNKSLNRSSEFEEKMSSSPNNSLNQSKKLKIENSSNEEMSGRSESSDESSADNLAITYLDSEASEAESDYQSGDSLNSSERRQIDENEIIEKGESLNSDLDSLSVRSDDTYEDSFICDEEEEEKLSGSGDDLSSGAELSQSRESKHAFNLKSEKERKRASKEMFEARHGTKKNSEDSGESSDDENLKSVKADYDNELKRLQQNSFVADDSDSNEQAENKMKKAKGINKSDVVVGSKRENSARLYKSLNLPSNNDDAVTSSEALKEILGLNLALAKVYTSIAKDLDDYKNSAIAHDLEVQKDVRSNDRKRKLSLSENNVDEEVQQKKARLLDETVAASNHIEISVIEENGLDAINSDIIFDSANVKPSTKKSRKDKSTKVINNAGSAADWIVENIPTTSNATVVSTTNFKVENLNKNSNAVTCTAGAGKFSISTIKKVKTVVRNVPFSHLGSNTNFNVLSLKQDRKRAMKIDDTVEDKVVNFRANMLYNDRIKRENSSDLFRKRQKMSVHGRVFQF